MKENKGIPTEIEWSPIRDSHFVKTSEIKRVLSQTRLFEDLNLRDWRQLTGLFHIRKYKEKEIIFENGTPGLGAYAILQGSVRIVGEKRGTSVDLAVLEKGAFFGEMSLIDESPRSASAIAVEETRLVGFFRPQLLHLMQTRPKLGVRLMKRLAELVAERLRIANVLLAECRDQLDSSGEE